MYHLIQTLAISKTFTRYKTICKKKKQLHDVVIIIIVLCGLLIQKIDI